MKRRIALILAAGALGGCLAPIPYQGNIPIRHEGLAQRLDAMCRIDLAADSQCPAETE